MMKKYELGSASACHGSASVSMRPGMLPRTILSTILHRAAACAFYPRRRTSRLRGTPGPCCQRACPDWSPGTRSVVFFMVATLRDERFLAAGVGALPDRHLRGGYLDKLDQ